MISANKQRCIYILGDFLSSNAAWFLYNCLRYNFNNRIISNGFYSLSSYLLSEMVILGQAIFPVLIVLIYAVSGYYNQPFHKSRVNELFNTATVSLVSAILIFFVALINDVILNERYYNYELVFMLWGILFGIVYLVRYLITSNLNRKIRNGHVFFNTLIIGTSEHAVLFSEQLKSMNSRLGYNIVGYVKTPYSETSKSIKLPIYNIDELGEVCSKQSVSELILIPSTHNVNTILETINRLYILDKTIKIAPDIYNILLGKMRLSNIIGEPLIDISGSSMSACEMNIKRILDVLISIVAITLLFPLFIAIGLLIKINSKGNVIYKQERVGHRNKTFYIYKFRSMWNDAEKDGKPELAAEFDDRITPIGRFLRKYRIDELPQFWNVLIGNMSLVGPRPERQYFIDQIMEKAPFYTLLHKVRPGITSMGMVKYGYARNVEEMIERFKYDLLYVENMSLTNDLKILIYTIKTVFTGKGL